MGSLFSYLNLWRFGREEVDYEELLAKTIFEATDEYEDSLLPPEERASRKERDKTITKIIYGAACLALLISVAMALTKLERFHPLKAILPLPFRWVM